jgi:ribonuclease HI
MKDLWARKEAFILYEFNQMVVTTPLDANYVKELKSETISRRWNPDKNAWVVDVSERDKVLQVTRQYFDVIEENRPQEGFPATAEPIETVSDEKPFNVQEGDKVEIWIDGFCAFNPGLGGYAVLLRHNGQVREIVGGYELTTNNRMDITAAIIALESLKTRCKVTIYSDSRYLVDSMKSGRAKRWLAVVRKGSNKKETINADLWQRLLDAREKHYVKFMWIKHSSTPENERCDKLAEAATLKSELLKDSGYKIYRKTQDSNKERNDTSNAKFKECLDKIETALKHGQRVDKKEFRTHLKQNYTKAEQLMWRYLINAARRKGQQRIHFVKQFPIGPYFADFYCQRAKLI